MSGNIEFAIAIDTSTDFIIFSLFLFILLVFSFVQPINLDNQSLMFYIFQIFLFSCIYNGESVQGECWEIFSVHQEEMFQTGRNCEIWPHFLYCIYFHIQLAILVGFSTPMLLSPELAELMGETHVSKVLVLIVC